MGAAVGVANNATRAVVAVQKGIDTANRKIDRAKENMDKVKNNLDSVKNQAGQLKQDYSSAINVRTRLYNIDFIFFLSR